MNKKQSEMHVIVGCIHLPFHNKPFFNSFCNFLYDHNEYISGLHLIGDILDIHSLSSHDNGKIALQGLTLDKEYKEASKCLDLIDMALGEDNSIEKNYIWGNHEDRYSRIMQFSDTSKYGKALLSPTEGCKFEERGYIVQEDYKNAVINLGKLDIIHGEYISSNSCKKHLDAYKTSIMFAHTHKIGQYYDVDKAAFNIGWMGDKNSPVFSYASRIAKMDWQNGFAVVIVDPDGYFHVNQIIWQNGKFFYGTKQY